MFSDAYKALGKIWYNGEFYDIVELMSINYISDYAKIKLIKHYLQIEIMTQEEHKNLK